jgi:hypothetical protein
MSNFTQNVKVLKEVPKTNPSDPGNIWNTGK